MLNIFDNINSIIKISNDEFQRINKYVEFLLEYNTKINLISKNSENDIWNRHIIDCIQLMKFFDNKDLKVADLGSGAGLPGILISILGMKKVSLFEKSIRKCEFLDIAKNFSNNEITIRNENLYNVKDNTYDIIVSRALANLDLLLHFSENLKKDNTKLFFLKGQKWEIELEEAKKNWHLEYEVYDSITSNEGKIIKILNYKKNK